MSAEPVLLVEKTGAICRLTLNRPEALNALNKELGDRLLAALDDCAEDGDVRAIVVAGSGRAFCAGDDIRAGARAAAAGETPRRRDLVTSVRSGNYFHFAQAFRSVPKPIIARVHGFAYGAGMDLVLASDMAIAADDARVGAVFVNSGIIGGTAQLPRYVPLKKAMEMLLSGEPVPAPRAVEIGLLNYAVPPDQLDAVVEQWAGKLADGPTRIMGTIKLAAYRGLDMHFEDSVMLAAAANGEASRTEDGVEGKRAFAQKRPPVFTGE
ncbi:MAG: enoyl-CoA hydratase/isomerase family protein [Chloroflexi bacterium]|nr:enoyl-CoA hydratase/isomerase family protein [Chloroflexota bacterium]